MGVPDTGLAKLEDPEAVEFLSMLMLSKALARLPNEELTSYGSPPGPPIPFGSALVARALKLLEVGDEGREEDTDVESEVGRVEAVNKPLSAWTALVEVGEVDPVGAGDEDWCRLETLELRL